eukprot:469154-Amphidinium_carterae.1
MELTAARAVGPSASGRPNDGLRRVGIASRSGENATRGSRHHCQRRRYVWGDAWRERWWRWWSIEGRTGATSTESENEEPNNDAGARGQAAVTAEPHGRPSHLRVGASRGAWQNCRCRLVHVSVDLLRVATGSVVVPALGILPRRGVGIESPLECLGPGERSAQSPPWQRRCRRLRELRGRLRQRAKGSLQLKDGELP